MGKYIVKRVILAIFTIFIISLITFFAMNAIPGGPFNSEKAKSPAVMKELEARYGLDQPLIVQYKNYMAGVLHGDFGVSLKTDRPISDIIGESFPISAKLGLLAALTAIVFGVVLGSIAALMRNRWPDRVIVFFVTLITSMPSFVIATLLLYFFCIKLGVVQAFSSGSNMVLLPVLSLSLSPMAYITRLTKTSMLDALGQDYIRTAKAKGLSNRAIIIKHALKNALIPVVTYIGVDFGGMLSGAILTETVFNWPGIGFEVYRAISMRDWPIVMGGVTLIVVVVMVINLLVDISYAFLDPRIRLGGPSDKA